MRCRDPYAKRDYVNGAHLFEKLKRVDTPTTYIDEPNVARVPKRTDMFACAQFGDMGKKMQEAAKGGHYVRKAAPSMAQRRALGAFVLLQDGAPASEKQTLDPKLVAWESKNPNPAYVNRPFQLIRTTWKNPHPEKEVRAIDFVSRKRVRRPFWWRSGLRWGR